MERGRAPRYTPSAGDNLPGHEHAEDAVEHEDEAAVPVRGQNQVLVAPEDWRDAAAVLESWYDRLEPEAAGPQLLVLTSDAGAGA